MAQPLPSRGDIVHCLISAERPLHGREIASRCGVSEGSYSRFLELLDQLSVDRSIRRLAGSRFKAQPPEDRAGGTWVGVLTVNPRGFGFVAAAGQDDVYVPADGMGGAMHGDRVTVRVVARTARGVEGRIEDIVARRKPRVAGVLRHRGRSVWLEPDDTRVRGPIVVSAGARFGKDGDAAVVEITRFPEVAKENPEGELVAVLGRPGEANAEVAKILVREQIVEEHPEQSLNEAETMAARIQALDVSQRVDLRDVPLPTIDPADARDHDDAIWVEKSPDGYRVWVAIADVAEYVQLDTALDEEARHRGCTIYLPDRAVPMLPAALSADLCSLLPDRERLCLCVRASLDRAGELQKFDVVEGVMRSQAMLTYDGVARALGFTEQPPRSAQAEAMKKDLRVLDELARKLRKRRLQRGALDLNLPEPQIKLDEATGTPLDVQRRAQDPGLKRAYQMVEELMLLANELVAQWLSERRAVAVYRVHGRPDEAKLERLGELAERLSIAVDVEALKTPLGLSKWLQKVHQHPRQSVLEMLLLRSLKQAAYDIVNIGHFGLASDAYLHFTSPIRRYPDLVVHRMVKHLLRGGKVARTASHVEDVRSMATSASVRERAAISVEREVVDLYRALFMREHVGEEFEGIVTALVGMGAFVALDSPFCDVLIRYEDLGPDDYALSEDELSVVGVRSGDRVELGDRVAVRVEDVAILRRMVYASRLLDERQLRKLEGRERRPKASGRTAGRGPSPAAARGRAPARAPGKPSESHTKSAKASKPSSKGSRAVARPSLGSASRDPKASRTTRGGGKKRPGSGFKHR